MIILSSTLDLSRRPPELPIAGRSSGRSSGAVLRCRDSGRTPRHTGHLMATDAMASTGDIGGASAGVLPAADTLS